jgi:hypothetical protein
MKTVANLSSIEREELFLVTARERALPEAVIEKQPPHSRDFSRELGGFFLQILVTYGIISTWIMKP